MDRSFLHGREIMKLKNLWFLSITDLFTVAQQISFKFMEAADLLSLQEIALIIGMSDFTCLIQQSSQLQSPFPAKIHCQQLNPIFSIFFQWSKTQL